MHKKLYVNPSKPPKSLCETTTRRQFFDGVILLTQPEVAHALRVTDLQFCLGCQLPGGPLLGDRTVATGEGHEQRALVLPA